MELPEITEVRRLTVRPGDRIIVRYAQRLDMETVDHISKRFSEAIGVENVQVIVLDGAPNIEVFGP